MQDEEQPSKMIIDLKEDFSDEEDIEIQPSNNLQIKASSHEEKIKYLAQANFASSTLEKSLFNVHETSQIYQQQQKDNEKLDEPQPDPEKNEQKTYDQKEERKKRRRAKIEQNKIQPLKKQQNNEVIINIQESSLAESKDFILNQQQIQKNKKIIQEQQQAKDQLLKSLQTNYLKESLKIPVLKENKSKKKIIDEGNVIVQESSQDYQKEEKIQKSDQPHQPIQVKEKVQQNYSSDEAKSPTKLKKTNVISISPSKITKYLTSPLTSNAVIQTTLKRNSSEWRNFFSPQFEVQFETNKSFIMGCKKTSNKPVSTFIMTGKKDNYEENGQFYIGKMKSNFLGDKLNIYSPGLNQQNAFQKSIKPRQLLATIIYEIIYFTGGKPRDFTVYVKKPDVDYFQLKGTVGVYEQQIPLDILYKEHEDNRNKIDVYENKKPIWKQQKNGYVLNFKGRVKKASIKNFVLQKKDDIEGKQVMIFGRLDEDQFVLDIFHPLSPEIGLGIALSAFDSKFSIQ